MAGRRPRRPSQLRGAAHTAGRCGTPVRTGKGNRVCCQVTCTCMYTANTLASNECMYNNHSSWMASHVCSHAHTLDTLTESTEPARGPMHVTLLWVYYLRWPHIKTLAAYMYRYSGRRCWHQRPYCKRRDCRAGVDAHVRPARQAAAWPAPTAA